MVAFSKVRNPGGEASREELYRVYVEIGELVKMPYKEVAIYVWTPEKQSGLKMRCQESP